MNGILIRERTAQRRVQDFEHRYGQTTLQLAYHAALPVVLNTELLHLIRVNFFIDTSDPLPYTAEADFLLSSLCKEIGEGLYEIDSNVRNVLLAKLVTEHGPNRIHQIAALLWYYTDRNLVWKDRVQLERAQQLTSLNVFDPSKAKQWFDMAESSYTGQQISKERDWFVAISKELERVNELYSQDRKPIERADVIRRCTQQYLQHITPSPDELTTINNVIEQLRLHFESIEALKGPGIKLFGSVARNTAIRPIQDVDILVIFRVKDPRRESPKNAYETLKYVLDQFYKQNLEETRKNRARLFSFGSSILVPLPQGRLEVTPATLLTDNAGERLMVPDNRLRNWTSANHEAHLKFTEDQDLRTNGQYTALVKMFKAWNRYHRVHPRYLKGFYLECLVGSYLGHKPQPLTSAFVSILDSIKQRFTDPKLSTYIYDPAVQSRRISIRRPPKSFIETVDRSLDFAQESKKAATIYDEINSWQKILGPEFTLISQSLRGREYEALTEALLSAFPTYDNLRVMVKSQLEVDLEWISASHGTLIEVVFDLIHWAEANGKISDLVLKANHYYPGNIHLENFIRKVIG